jgi:hypothetical protein
VGKNGGETATIDATQVQDSESVNVRLWHFADIDADADHVRS